MGTSNILIQSNRVFLKGFLIMFYNIGLTEFRNNMWYNARMRRKIRISKKSTIVKLFKFTGVKISLSGNNKPIFCSKRCHGQWFFRRAANLAYPLSTLYSGLVCTKCNIVNLVAYNCKLYPVFIDLQKVYGNVG